MASEALAAGKPVVIVGAGLAGTMLACLLSQKGINVEVYEKRPDARVEEAAEAARLHHLGQSTDPTKRSINLALSHRGRSALAAAGVEERVLRECVRMPCRAIHDRSGHITTQPYGTGDQAIFSASRSLLNRVVLEQCEAAGSSAASSSSSSSSGAGAGAGAAGSRPRGTVSIYFEYGLKTLDAQGNAVFENTRTKDTRAVAAALVVGADGAYSAVRERMLRLARLSYSREYIAHGYKELNMAPVPVKAAGYAGAGAASGGAGAASAACGEAETWAMPVAEALHIWPRDGHMLIALPNPDKTFTCTLFLPWEQLDALDADPAAAKAWFGANFPDALPLIADFETQFARNPSSALVMTKCDPWVVGDRVTLIGDAAHSVVPFYGQGANAAFEDCLFFVECLDACAGDLSAAVRKYAKERKPAGDALAKLSLDNYVEMRAKTASAAFLLRKRFEAGLHWLAPSSWIPQYTMVAFTRIPYHEVIAREERQDAILTWSLRAVAAAGAVAAGYVAVKKGWAAQAGASLGGLLERFTKK